MSRTTRSQVALLLISASLAGSVAACSRNGESTGVSGSHSAVSQGQAEFDPNDVLDDASMSDTHMTAAEVQAFLDRTPYGTASALATYKPVKTKTAAQIIVGAAATYAVNPMLLLVRAQLENGLISKRTATETELAGAFGCGCAATSTSTSTAAAAAAVCTPSAEARGFENQARCAASQLRTSLDRLAGKGNVAGATSVTTDGTSKGWAAHKPQKTRDGIEVTPANDATAVLYAYKPWVGKLGNGDPTAGGMSAHWTLWNDFTNPAPDTTGSADNASSAQSPSGSDSGDGTQNGTPTSECTPPCGAGSVCNESTGACVSGCRVLDGNDSCGSGSRCDRSDGLIGRCMKSDCGSQCTGGSFCDSTSSSPRCVQCNANDMTACQPDTDGSACIAGRCGCEVSADCGYGAGRICDRLHGVCVDAPPVATPPDPATPGPSDPDAGTDPVPPAQDASVDTTATAPATDPNPTPTPTPDFPPSSDSSSSSSADGGRAPDDKIDVPGSANGGCATAPSGGPPSHGATGIGALLLALVGVLGRRHGRSKTN